MFNEKPPMLGGNPAADLAALRDYLFRMSRGLEDVTVAVSTGNVAGNQATSGGSAAKSDIEKVRKNAEELKALIIKSAEDMQEQIDNIELTTFYVKYADDFTGSYPATMYNTPTANTVYMGVCSAASATAPTDPSVYTWSRVKGNTGAAGQDGAPGTPGANGQTTYLHIKYSDDGQTFTGNSGEDLGAFIGMYTDYTQADSTTFSDYVWHRFADDTELKAMIADGDADVISYVDRKVDLYNSLYVAKSEYGTFTETIDSRIMTAAQGVVESYDYDAMIQSNQDSIHLLQNYLTSIDGEIRRGIVQDPDTGNYVTGIAIAQKLSFTGECGTDDPNHPEGDNYTYYYMTEGQTFGLYTSTGWQFWIDGYKKGWFNSLDGMLHIANVFIEQNLQFGSQWKIGYGIRTGELVYIGG